MPKLTDYVLSSIAEEKNAGATWFVEPFGFGHIHPSFRHLRRRHGRQGLVCVKSIGKNVVGWSLSTPEPKLMESFQRSLCRRIVLTEER